MAIQKSTRMWILLGIDVAFFLVELIVGYSVHSLALVADAFHMLNDVISLCISIWAVMAASKRADSRYTYGLQRSEVLGALVNGVFLVALCVSIFLEAIKRFFQPQTVNNPMLVLIVGCCGLASNIVGLFLFHDHGHTHSEEQPQIAGDGLAAAEAGNTNGVVLSTDQKPAAQIVVPSGDGTVDPPAPAYTTNGNTANSCSPSKAKEDSPGSLRKAPSQRNHRRHASAASRPRHASFEEMHVHPASFRNEIIQAARLDEIDSGDSTEAEGPGEPNDPDSGASSPTEGSALLQRDWGRPRPYSSPDLAAPAGVWRPSNDGAADAREPDQRRSASIEHHRHKHCQPAAAGSGGHSHAGHSHGDLNMRGVFLHVLGDALGNVGVIATALFIWLTPFEWRFYMDPLVSLLIACIILKTALPLCRASARILLQAVPAGLSVDDVREDIEALPGVVACHHLHVWQLSGAKLVASLHVRLACDFNFGDGARGARRYMRLARAVRTCLHEYGIHSSTIQPEFCLDTRHEHIRLLDAGGDADGGKDSGGNGHDGSPSGDGGGSGSATEAGRGLGGLRVRTMPGSGGSKLPTLNSLGSSPREACLLECDDGCTLKKCCVTPGDRDDGGKGH